MLFPSRKALFFVFAFKNFLRHQSVNGAPPPKKNPGSAPVILEKEADNEIAISLPVVFKSVKKMKICFKNKTK